MVNATKPRELPILMHARSIEGILAGRKRQTRRILKPQPEGAWAAPGRQSGPYGAIGDLLYVRETWRPHSWPEGEPVTVEFRDGTRVEADHYSVVEDFDRYSDWEERVGRTACQQLEARGVMPDEAGVYTWEGDSPLPWRPGIHLPKWCSRIWLRVTDVRVERVQEISVEDIRAEGVRPGEQLGTDYRAYELAMRTAFRQLWGETNGAGTWERNDWCWVVSFEVTEAPR